MSVGFEQGRSSLGALALALLAGLPAPAEPAWEVDTKG